MGGIPKRVKRVLNIAAITCVSLQYALVVTSIVNQYDRKQEMGALVENMRSRHHFRGFIRDAYCNANFDMKCSGSHLERQIVLAQSAVRMQIDQPRTYEINVVR